MTWDERAGLFTAAFGLWQMAEQEQQVYLTRTATLIDDANAEISRSLPEERPHDPNAGLFQPPGPIDLFFDEVGGLMPHDHHWLLCASVVKDAVTSFEVYVEAALDEVCLRNERDTLWHLKKAPHWGDLLKAWTDELGVNVADDDLVHVRHLRHVLTHRRGMCSSKEDMDRFQVTEFERVPLDNDRVLVTMAVLGGIVRRIDPAAKAACWAPEDGAGLCC